MPLYLHMVQLVKFHLKKNPRKQVFDVFIRVYSMWHAFLSTHRKSPVNEYVSMCFT